MTMRGAGTLAGLLAAGLVVAGLTPAAEAATVAQPGTRICTSNGHVLVHPRHDRTEYVVRDAYWLGQRPQCLANRGNLDNFKVVQRPGFNAAGHVVAYPDIYRGCIWTICSPAAYLPRPVSALGHPVATWHTSEHADGTWNAAFDIWFGKKRMTTGQADGAELMIWLNEHGGCCALQHGAPKVWIDGQQWWFSHWRTRHNGVSWNYIQFRRVHRTWNVTRLKLYPFVQLIRRMELIRSDWWLENVEAGFELWSGGHGLATTQYAVGGIRPRK
jgi:Glycosyl hydrolase family 12